MLSSTTHFAETPNLQTRKPIKILKNPQRKKCVKYKSNSTIQRQCLITEKTIQKAKLGQQKLKNKEVLLRIQNKRRQAEILKLQKEKLTMEITLMKSNFI